MNTAKRLENYVINENESIYKAHWKLYKNGDILVVLDDNEKYQGVLTFSDFQQTFKDENRSLKEIVNRNGKFVQWDDDEDIIYENARNIFYRYQQIHHIPIIKDGYLVDIYSRQRVFWKQYFDAGTLPRMHYAKSLYYSAMEAKQLEYEEVTAIEFGVAGGGGVF